jgi:hypothetical protein
MAYDYGRFIRGKKPTLGLSSHSHQPSAISLTTFQRLNNQHFNNE